MSENIIKSALDGLFYTVDQFGATRVRRVPKDYIPKHTGIFHQEPRTENVTPLVPAVKFTPAEDEALFSNRRGGMSWDDLALTMRRGIKTIRDRYLVLCHERGVSPDIDMKLIKRSPMPADIQASIIRMRDRGVSLRDIAARLELRYWVVRDFCRRNLTEAA